jgi:hypothetical protein
MTSGLFFTIYLGWLIFAIPTSAYLVYAKLDSPGVVTAVATLTAMFLPPVLLAYLLILSLFPNKRSD